MTGSMIEAEDQQGQEVPPAPEMRLFQVEKYDGSSVGIEAHSVHESDGVLIFSVYTRVPGSNGYIQSYRYMFKEWVSVMELVVTPGTKSLAN